MAFQEIASSAVEIEPAENTTPNVLELTSETEVLLEPEEEVDVQVLEDDEPDVEVEIVDDVPPEDRNRTPAPAPEEITDEELSKYNKKAEQRIKHFSKGYHDERRAKEQAMRDSTELQNLARNLLEENKTLKGSVSKNQTTMLEQARRVVNGEVDNAKRMLKEAYDSGESDQLLSAQEALTKASIRAYKLASVKLPAGQPAETTVQVEPEQARPQQVQPQRDERADDWAAENTWFGPSGDAEMTSLALGLHTKLTVEKGLSPISDEYYAAIDARMREVFPDQFDEEPKDSKQVRAPDVVAPATRSVKAKSIRLSATQKSLARTLGLTVQQYANQAAKDTTRKQ